MPTFEIAPQHVCSPVNLLHIFRTPFPKNSSGCRAVGSSSTLKVPNLKGHFKLVKQEDPPWLAPTRQGEILILNPLECVTRLGHYLLSFFILTHQNGFKETIE